MPETFLDPLPDPPSLALRLPKTEFRRRSKDLPASALSFPCSAEPTESVREMAEFLFAEEPVPWDGVHKSPSVLTSAHMSAIIPPGAEVAVAQPTKYPKREREGITRWPIEIEDSIAENFVKTAARVYPLVKRNVVLREIILNFIEEHKEK